MSLEAVIESNTLAISEQNALLRNLLAALQAGGTIAAPREPVPGVAQLEAQRAALDSGEKQQPPAATAKDAAAGDAPTPESSKPGRASVSTPTSSNGEPQTAGELKPWHEKTAPFYAELKDAPVTLETCKKTILAVNANISREQAVALLSRFGAETVAPKPDKKHLDESLFGDYMALALEILAGRADATEAQFQPE
ncbi:hypothetical protein [Burkholderia glumae]|uniref:hypothetical protein n=1 Tax=Burkholderia glumae TaxID=337 RepID=UPI0021517482|nr:hypothetical protein [Burkholderia glumae]